MARKPTIPLTQTQEQYLLLLGDGLTFDQVAEQMVVTPYAVKRAAKVLRRKFRVAKTRELVPISRQYFRD